MSSLGYLRWEAWSGLIVRASYMFWERVRCATGSSCEEAGFSVLDVWCDLVRAATGWVFCSPGSITLGSVGDSTLGGGACTLGAGGSTLGYVYRILGDRRSSHLSFVVWTGGGGGAWGVVLYPDHLSSAFWRAWIASNWSLECEDSDFCKAEVNWYIPCSTLYLVVTEGWVRCWWRSSMVLEIESAHEYLGMYRWHR